jgi:hypothetical protein
MAYNIIETVILSAEEIKLYDGRLLEFICDSLGCPWTTERGDLRRIFKVHYTNDGYIIEYNRAEWHNCIQREGILEVKDPSLVDHYFTKHTSQTWQKLLPLITVIDPDGWDRSNYDYSWKEEMITRREYDERVMYSTCMQMR